MSSRLRSVDFGIGTSVRGQAANIRDRWILGLGTGIGRKDRQAALPANHNGLPEAVAKCRCDGVAATHHRS